MNFLKIIANVVFGYILYFGLGYYLITILFPATDLSLLSMIIGLIFWPILLLYHMLFYVIAVFLILLIFVLFAIILTPADKYDYD